MMKRLLIAFPLLLALCLSACGSSIPTTGAGGGSSGPPSPPISATFKSWSHDTVDRTTYSWTGVSFGTDTASRRIVVIIDGLQTGGARSISSVSIGDDASPVLVDGIGSTTAPISMYIGDPTGTSGTISATFSGIMMNAAYAAFDLENANPTAFAHTTSTNGVPGGTNTSTISIPADGIAIGGTFVVGTALAATNLTWTGLTETSDRGQYSSTGTANGGTAGTSQAVSIATSNTADLTGPWNTVVASWGK